MCYARANIYGIQQLVEVDLSILKAIYDFFIALL